jgi:hypothetical protein
VCVAEEEARVIGNNFMPCLRSKKRPQSGVAQWEDQNRAVAEVRLDEKRNSGSGGFDMYPNRQP